MKMNISHLLIGSILGICLVACSQSNEPQFQQKNEAIPLNLTLTVNSLYDNDSRAGGNCYIPEGYQLRYTIAAFVETNGIPSAEEATRTTAYSEIAPEGGTALTDVFTHLHLNLVPHTSYTLVAWADYIHPADLTMPNAQTTFYYNIDNLRAIKPTDEPLSEVNAEDAYLGIQTGYKISDDVSNHMLTLSLKRPLVKIEFQNISEVSAAVPYSLDYTIINNDLSKTAITFDAVTREVAGNHIRLGETMKASPYGYLFVPSSGCNLSVSVIANETPYGVKWEKNGPTTPLQLFVLPNQQVTIQPVNGDELTLHPLITRQIDEI